MDGDENNMSQNSESGEDNMDQGRNVIELG
jgi:hypothetical protein